MNRQDFDTALNTLKNSALNTVLTKIGVSPEGLDRPNMIHRLHEEYSDAAIATLTRADVGRF